MSQSFTSDTLITSVKRWAMIPEDQNTFTASDFLDIANEELIMNVVPEILRLHEDFFLISEDVQITQGVKRYRIPHRAIGNKLRDVRYKDSNGNLLELTRIAIDDVADESRAYTTNRIYAYYIENQDVVLLPASTPVSGGFLVFSYYLRPNNMVLSNRVGTITAINTSTGELTLDSVPTVFTGTETYDIIDKHSPHFTTALDLSGTVGASSITFAPASLPSGLKVGDFVSLSGETKVPQIPADIHPYLARRVTMRCLEAMGDNESLGIATQKAAEMSNKLTNLIDNRVEASPKKIVNRHGHFRQGRINGRRRGY